MAQKYTVTTSSSSTDRLGGVQIATATLSDGTVVWVDYDPTTGPALNLRYSNSRTAVDGTIATMSGYVAPASTRPNMLVIAVDSSDNIYVAGQSSASTAKLQLQAFAKGTGYTWTAQTAATYDGTGVSAVFTAMGAVWANTGGGTNSKGHLVVMAQDTGLVTKDFRTFDAGLLLTNTLSTISQVSTTGKTVTSIGTAGADIASDGLGSTTLAALFPSNQTGTWQLISMTVSSAGVMTVTSTGTFTAGSAAPASGQRARLIRYASNAWVALVVNETTGAITGQRCSASALVGSAAAMGALTDVPSFHTSPLLWDAFLDPSTANKVWVLCRSSATANKLYRVGCGVASAVTWDAGTTADDTSVGNTINNLRVNKMPAVPYTDWHVENFDGTNYELYGDYTTFQSPPLAPTLTAPANASYQDLQAGYTFAWTYNPGVIGNTQTAYALRRKISGAGSYEWWNAGTGAWQGTEIFNTSSSSSLTFAASKWTDGNIYNWSVNTKDAGGTGTYAADFTVTASAPPSVTVSTPSGTAAASSPTVSWSDTLQSGALQTNYRVVVESGAFGTVPGSGTTLWDSGVVSSSSTSVTTGGTLVNGTTYRWFVQVTETGGQTSSWAHSDATASFTPPSTPTLTATGDNTNARTALVLTNNDAGAVTGGVIEYSDNGGTTWATVRGASALPLGAHLGGSDTFSTYDYEATPGVARRYRARVSNTQGGQIVTSLNATAGPVTITITTWWLKDVLFPANNVAIPVNAETFDTEVDDRSGQFDILGRSRDVVVSDGIGGASFSLPVLTTTAAAYTALVTISTSSHVLLVQSPYGEQWYVWVLKSKRSLSRSGTAAPYRITTLDVVEVDAP